MITAPTSITPVSEKNYQQEVKEHAGRVLVDFYTPTCASCRAMAPVVEQIASERGDKLKVVKIDASIEHELTASFQITSVPSFVLLDSGEQKAELNGLQLKSDIDEWLDENP